MRSNIWDNPAFVRSAANNSFGGSRASQARSRTQAAQYAPSHAARGPSQRLAAAHTVFAAASALGGFPAHHAVSPVVRGLTAAASPRRAFVGAGMGAVTGIPGGRAGASHDYIHEAFARRAHRPAPVSAARTGLTHLFPPAARPHLPDYAPQPRTALTREILRPHTPYVPRGID